MEIALPTNSVTNLLTAIYALRATTTVPQEPPAEIDRGSLKVLRSLFCSTLGPDIGGEYERETRDFATRLFPW